MLMSLSWGAIVMLPSIARNQPGVPDEGSPDDLFKSQNEIRVFFTDQAAAERHIESSYSTLIRLT
jgi:hypothetical protein